MKRFKSITSTPEGTAQITSYQWLLAAFPPASPPRRNFETWRAKYVQELERASTFEDDRKDKYFKRWATPAGKDRQGRQLYANGGLVYPAISHRATVVLYSGMIKVRMPAYRKSPDKPPQRGAIIGMSPRSRKRMMEAIAQWRNFDDELGHFITITYHDTWGVHFSAWKRDIDVLIKRMRRAFPSVGGVWKLEFQKRGAPHFHLLTSGINVTQGELREWIAKNWGEIAHSESEYQGAYATQVDRVWSRRHAMHYATKYMTKDIPEWVNPDKETGELEQIPTGRVWAFFGEVDRTPIAEMSVLPHVARWYKNMVIAHLVKTNSRFAERLYHMSDDRSWSVFGIGGANARDIIQWRDFLRRQWRFREIGDEKCLTLNRKQ